MTSSRMSIARLQQRVASSQSPFGIASLNDCRALCETKKIRLILLSQRFHTAVYSL